MIETRGLRKDAWLVFQRQMLLVIRTPIGIAVGVIQPVICLTLFAKHLGEKVVWEGAIVVAALTALGLAGSTRLFARGLR